MKSVPTWLGAWWGEGRRGGVLPLSNLTAREHPVESAQAQKALYIYLSGPGLYLLEKLSQEIEIDHNKFASYLRDIAAWKRWD